MEEEISSDEIKLLRSEYERISADIRTYESLNEKFVGVSLAVVTAFFAYGVKEKFESALIISSFALAWLLIFSILNYKNIYRSGGYKKSIEIIVNKSFSRNVLWWEHLNHDHKKKSRPTGILLAVATYVIFASVAIYTDIKIFIAFGLYAGAGYAIMFIIFSILSYVYAYRTVDSYEEALQESLSVAMKRV